ncbi:MAG TPA: ATP-binding protein [Candidatus Nanopusillus sp.]|nr:ATP-binding protein [Candidatus Nanopusillus sp.]
MVDILIGRDEKDIEEFGLFGTIFIGKEYIKMENIISLANRIYLDVNKPHLILICGKRGQGKSYTLASIAESIAMLPKELSRNVTILIFDTMGIFWTMKFPNYRDAELLERWNLRPMGLKNVKIYVPEGIIDLYRDINVPIDSSFTINPADLSGFEWSLVFGLNPTSTVAIYIQKVIRRLKKRDNIYSIEEIISYVESLSIDPKIKDKITNYFETADSWGLFSKDAPNLKHMLEPGTVNILDVSMYTAFTGGWSIKNLVIGLVSKKIFYERMLYRKKEELENAHLGLEIKSREFPLVWIMIDEAHESLPKDGVTPATEPLVQIIREGRQPGITLVLATQQPGKMHTDVLTQSDIVVSHRVTAQRDLKALNEIMKNFSMQDIEVYMNENLPKRKGAALILDDKSERIYPVQIKPRVSWHGGQDPSLIRKRVWLEHLQSK